MRTFITQLLSCPVAMSAFVLLVSAGALGGAYIAQYVFDLQPCSLCLYQRIPFIIGIVLGLAGLALYKNLRAFTLVISLGALNFLSNSALAFYHSGVERHWWASFLEGCSVPDLGEDPAAMFEKIMSAQAARCDEIPWADPILGLSMANYNILLCFGAFIVCITSLIIRKAQN